MIKVTKYRFYYYTDRLGIWLSVDPPADKYPGLSPYAYCANNPVMFVDPDGREAKKTQGKGNIQNKEWSKISSIIPKNLYVPYTVDCFAAAKEQMYAVGYTVRDGDNKLFQTYSDYTPDAKEKNGFQEASDKAIVQQAVDYVNSMLEQNKPVMVGVTYDNGEYLGNNDKTTDHWVVITGRGYDSEKKQKGFIIILKTTY